MEAEYKIQQILPIILEGDAKGDHYNDWRKYSERKSQLEKQHGQALFMIGGQLMQVPLDKVKHGIYWGNTDES